MRSLLLPGLFSLLLSAAASNQPRLVEAAKNGDREALRSLLSKKAEDVNATEGDGATALHWASYRDDLESAALLIQAGADVKAANDLGVTPLWAACQNGSAAMVRKLLDAGADVNAALLLGETPLMMAARAGHAAIAALLASRGARVNAPGPRGQTAIMWAVARKHPEVLKVLLAHGAGVHARSDAWSQIMAVPPHGHPEYNRAIPHGGNTALLFAARVGDLESAKLLAAAGANVNDKDAWGVTATVLAAHSGFREVVEFLLEKGADPNLAEAGFTALHIAILRRDEKMASALLASGADPHARLGAWTPTRRSSRDWHFEPALMGASPYWLAARYNLPAVMRMLAKRGADPRFVHRLTFVAGERFQQRTEATTALMAALGLGGGGAAWVPPPPAEREASMLESVSTAIELGADVNAKNADGQTALAAARRLPSPPAVRLLLEKGAR